MATSITLNAGQRERIREIAADVDTDVAKVIDEALTALERELARRRPVVPNVHASSRAKAGIMPIQPTVKKKRSGR